MIAILLIWLVELFIFFSFGDLLIRLLGKKVSISTHYPFVETSFIGICVVGTLICWSSICIPVNGILLAVFLGLAMLYWAFHIKRLKEIVKTYKSDLQKPTFWEIGFLILIGYIVLYYSVQPPRSYDTGLYHLQAIMWDESYPVVPGLANLHGRFGFNSNSLLLSSVFNFRQVFSQPIFAVHSLCLLLLFIKLITNACKTKSILTIFSIFIFIYLFIDLYKNDISSPSTDLLPNIFVAFLLFSLFFNSEALKKQPLLFLILPIYCLTLKLSVAPICLFSLFILIQFFRSRQYKSFWIAIALCFVVILPWFIRNIILSGYLIYPFPAIDIFNFDWKTPLSIIQNDKDWIHSWARVSGESASVVLQMPFSKWFPIWFSNQEILKKILFIVCCISPILTFLLFLKRKKRNIQLVVFFAWIVAFLGAFFWFASAPDFRFGYSFVLISCLFPLLLLTRKDVSLWNKKPFLYTGINMLFLIFALLFMFKSYKPQKELFKKPASVKTIYNVEEMNFITHSINNVIIYTPPEGCDQCFDQKLPCTPYFKNSLKMRGVTLNEGFKFEPENIPQI